MRRLHLTTASLISALHQPATRDELADPDGSVLVVDLDAGKEAAQDLTEHRALLASLPAVVIGTSRVAGRTEEAAALCDTVIADGDPSLDAILRTVAANPRAATALALLLRAGDRLAVQDGLVVESAAYSMLQAADEFRAWRAAHPARVRPSGHCTVVRVARAGNDLEILLDRPQLRNALDAAMRDQLYEALTLAATDRSLRVWLRGSGPDFCAGGDLDEFGTAPDPAAGHLIRLSRSLGWIVHAVRDRITVELHGACIGSGIEIPAFASRVLARADARIALPELSMGLIPGAGGTVSIPRRIGRHATAYLALTGATVDAATALSWGLVDEVLET